MRIKLAKGLFWVNSLLAATIMILGIARNLFSRYIDATVTSTLMSYPAKIGLALILVTWVLDREKNIWSGAFLKAENPRLWTLHRRVFKILFCLLGLSILVSFAMHTTVKTTYIPAG